MLEAINVVTELGGAPIIKGVSFHIEEGEAVGIMGRNGVGKTTLIRSILRLIPIKSGKITINGIDITNMSPHKASKLAKVGYFPQNRRVFPYLTVYENLRVAAIDFTKAEFEKRLEEIFDMFPRLRERKKQFAGTLSGGEQTMLAIGRALIRDPKLVILDEPTEGLMPSFVGLVIDVLKHLRKEKRSILLVEQNIDATNEVCDRVYFMDMGLIKHEAETKNLTHELIARYLGVSG